MGNSTNKIKTLLYGVLVSITGFLNWKLEKHALILSFFLLITLPAGADAEIAVATTSNAELEPAVASDGNNYLVVWHEGNLGDASIKGSLIRASDGVVLKSDIIISSTTGSQMRAAVSFDGTNYLVVWMDTRLGSDNHIYGARVSASDGTVLDPSGFLISSTSSEQTEPSVGCDGTNCLVVWVDNRNYYSTGWDFYGARVRVSDATVLGEITISTSASSNDGSPSVAFNGTNYLVAWGENAKVYAKRIDIERTVLDSSPIIVTTNLGYYDLSAASDGSGYFVAWRVWGNEDDIYGARIDSNGTVLDPLGIAITTATNYQREVSAMFDGTNYFVAWHDFPNGGTGDIYGARISTSGIVLDPSGILLSGHSADQYEPAVAHSNSNSMVVWRDYRDGNWDIYGELFISPPNQPPIANAGPDQTVEATGPAGASVTLNGSASFDPDGDTLTFNWIGPFGSVSGESPTVTLPLGRHTVSLTVSDGQTTSSDSVIITVQDTTPPTISLTNPWRQIYACAVTLVFDAIDNESGVASLSATLNGTPVSNGQTVTLTKPGVNTLSVTATDGAGNSSIQTVTFSVTYNFIGFLQPINNDGSSIFKLGSTVPIKFQLTDCNGVAVTTAVGTLAVFKITDAVLGTTEEVSVDASGSSNTDNLFRYSDPNYIYNLGTKPYTQGTYRLQANLDDGTVHTVDISLKAK